MRTALGIGAMLIGGLASSQAHAVSVMKPYGFILGMGAYNNGNPYPSDLAFIATNSASLPKSFLITARHSRLGFRVQPDTTVPASGVVEVDFWGLRGSTSGGGVQQTSIRLRLAYVKLQPNPRTTLTIGQDWIPFAPVNPGVPGLLTTCGNLWTRLPQARLDYAAKPFLFQFALVRPFAGDMATTPVEQTDPIGAGERSALPAIQARVAFTPLAGLTLGLSGHMAKQDWNDGTGTITSQAGAFDYDFRRGPFGLKGEVATGKSLGGLNSLTKFHQDPIGGKRYAETGMSGWAEATYKITPKWMASIAAGQEKADWNATHTAMLTRQTMDRNRAGYVNLIWQPWAPFRLITQLDVIRSHYIAPAQEHKAETVTVGAMLIF
jgi:hypothetical protein